MRLHNLLCVLLDLPVDSSEEEVVQRVAELIDETLPTLDSLPAAREQFEN